MCTRPVETPAAGGDRPAFDVERIRRDFPILAQAINGRRLVYLDNAATTHKPAVVLDAVRRYYELDNANVHRGAHALSRRATDAYERARRVVQRFLGAGSTAEIVFTRGATESINLVAQSCGRTRLQAGDEVVITALEHHSNIVPWQMVCEQTGARLRVAPINDAGEVIVDEFERLLGPRTRLVSIAHISNALGTINPVRAMIESAHRQGACVVVDGAQAVAHLRVDVRELDCDFYAFSGHKVFAPTGIGVLYGKQALLEAIPPYQGGGEMISSVTFEQTTFNAPPSKFEAGTPHVSGAVGLGAALAYVQEVGLDAAAAYEGDLLRHAVSALSDIPRVRLIGMPAARACVLSFVIEGVDAHDIGAVLDGEGIAIRTGHHCAEPLMRRLGLPATARASLAFYNTREEIDAFVAGVRRVIELFG